MPTRFSDRLLLWFDTNGRKDLPWQQDISPYRVWVSEIMLQQTQVTTVIPYFEKFMQRFPLVNRLAEATEDEVLHLWTGLGYYARARNLHKTAQTITTDYGGEFPARLEALVALPGIGRSTAGAIIAIAHEHKATILDANVKRVLTRYLGIEGWPGKPAVANRLWTEAERRTPDNRIADYTQAIMDLGATLCTRSRPGCGNCPLRADCFAAINDRTDQLPGKKPAKALPEKSTCMLMVENGRGELLLEKRPNVGLWGGLWSFPECQKDEIEAALLALSINPSAIEMQASFRFTFTHFHLDITPVRVKLRDGGTPGISEPGQRLWYSVDEPVEIGLTRPVTKLMRQFKRING